MNPLSLLLVVQLKHICVNSFQAIQLQLKFIYMQSSEIDNHLTLHCMMMLGLKFWDKHLLEEEEI